MIRKLSACAALALLAACGSNNTAVDGARTMASVLQGATSGAGEPNVVTPQQLASELAASNAPLVLVITDETKNQALLREIARNGRDATFATAEREAVIMRDGLVIGTRGLGGDLMSSVQGALERLVRNRQNGEARIEFVFLDGADQPDRRQYSCTVATAGQAPVTAGTINTTARIVTAKCAGPDEFNNTYLVAGDGYIVGSRQWAGPWIGSLSTQALRR